MKHLIAKSLLKVINGIEKYISVIRINADRNITLGENVFIHPTARIETRFGGSITIGNNTKIWDHVLIFSYGGDIVIGENCDINPYTIIYGHGGTWIGNDVLIAGHCMIIPNNHNIHDTTKNILKQGGTKKGIQIESNVWIAHSCSILDNVKISQGAVVAAGSVVTKNIEVNSICAGVPAKEIKRRGEG